MSGWCTGRIAHSGLTLATSRRLNRPESHRIGGRLDKRFGPKPVLTGAIVVLIAVCIVIVGLSRDNLYGIPLDEAGSTAADAPKMPKTPICVIDQPSTLLA